MDGNSLTPLKYVTDWSEARILAVALLVPSDNRLSHEEIHSPEAKWYPVNLLDTVG